MGNAFSKLYRLKKALASRGIDPKLIDAYKLLDTLAKRGMTDTIMNNVVWSIITALEPPSCFMTHCEHYGSSPSPMNCAKERTPGRCKLNRDFGKRQIERKRKKVAIFLETCTPHQTKYVAEKFGPVAAMKKDAIEELVRQMDSHQSSTDRREP